MVYIPIAEAVKRLGKSDRQVRRMAHGGQLTYRHVPDTKGKRLEILAADVDRLSRHALPAQELERLDRLEQELIQLRARLDAMSSQVDTFTTSRERSPQKSIVRPLQPQSEHSTMPPGLVGWRAFSRLHGIGESTTQNAIETGRLSIVPGVWIVGRAKVQGALDQAGRAQFYELYRKKPQFKPCEQCPHA